MAQKVSFVALLVLHLLNVVHTSCYYFYYRQSVCWFDSLQSLQIKVERRLGRQGKLIGFSCCCVSSRMESNDIYISTTAKNNYNRSRVESKGYRAGRASRAKVCQSGQSLGSRWSVTTKRNKTKEQPATDGFLASFVAWIVVFCCRYISNDVLDESLYRFLPALRKVLAASEFLFGVFFSLLLFMFVCFERRLGWQKGSTQWDRIFTVCN